MPRSIRNLPKIQLWAIPVALFAVGILGGCANDDDGLSKEQHASADQFKEIMDRTQGDWSKLTEEDKKVVLDKTNGNEQAARTMFEMRANRMPPTTGPAGGPPGGPR